MKKIIKLVYVAGPYTGKTKLERNINIERARFVGMALWKVGFAVITPHLNSIYMDDYEDLPPEVYYEGDLVILERCDAIFMLKGWEDSKGSVIEHTFAKENKIPIFYNMEEILKWQNN